MPKKKMGRPVTTGSGTPVLVRFHTDQLQEIEDWIAQQAEPFTLPEAIRRLTIASARAIAASKKR